MSRSLLAPPPAAAREAERSLTLADYCRRTGREDLLAEWDAGANAGLTPDRVRAGSHRAVWWRCGLGHAWRAEVRSRALGGTDCPVCANRVAEAGFNDLATLRPDLAEQWDRERNGDLTPDQVTAGSHRAVWWRCGRGHSWRAQICSRTQNDCGCPVCAGKVVVPGFNDLATVNPAVAAQWDPERNGDLTPRQVSAGSNRRAWWRCERGHRWEAVIAHRGLKNVGCPYCANRRVLPGFNDLATTHPRLAAQWHPTLNLPLTPEQVTAGSHRAVWWICEHGHVWKARLYSRTGGGQAGCPVCAQPPRRQRR